MLLLHNCILSRTLKTPHTYQFPSKHTVKLPQTYMDYSHAHRQGNHNRNTYIACETGVEVTQHTHHPPNNYIFHAILHSYLVIRVAGFYTIVVRPLN
jgi:hypothetical protein